MLGKAARDEEEPYRGTGKPGRGREPAARRPRDERTPPRPGAREPYLSQEQQRREDHHNPYPEPADYTGFTTLSTTTPAKAGGRSASTSHLRAYHTTAALIATESTAVSATTVVGLDEEEQRHAGEDEPEPGQSRDTPARNATKSATNREALNMSRK